MSSHSDPDRERRAREEAEARDKMLEAMQWNRMEIPEHRGGFPRHASNCECSDCAAYREAMLDAYAEAVRQAERDRMARVVEGMRDGARLTPTCLGCGRAQDEGFNTACARVLTALAAPPEGS